MMNSSDSWKTNAASLEAIHDRDLTFKRPHGFVLDGQVTLGITTWRRGSFGGRPGRC